MKKIYLPAVATAVFWLASILPGRAGHIVGGEFTYRCLGNGDYEFTLRLYRDGNCTDCAMAFDPQASFAIYRCDGAGCNIFSQANPYAQFFVSLDEEREVEAPDYPCLIPPNVKVLEGVYTFRLSDFNISLPPGNVTYHITHQRCCRNITINNIFNPGSTGATYTLALSPYAQAECNISPVFKDFPPIVICEGIPFEYDHGAIDSEGDSLAYSFCTPLTGGGPITTSPTLTTCVGAAPTPACPPPYNTVDYLTPTYTTQQPMLGNPVVTIDPITGMITGTPNIIGQFVVGVCVEEWRDGQLIGKVFRDFQFNVASCDPTVIARVRSDQEPSPQEFVINSCGDSTITFFNESFQPQFIDVVEWAFDLGNADTTFSGEWNPTITFPGLGQYTGMLILNEGTNCSDSADITVNIYPDIRAEFEFDYDTCRPGPVQFTDLSYTGSGVFTGWAWNFGDGNTSPQQNPTHVYSTPNEQNVVLTVTDINQCVDSWTEVVPYFPLPETILLGPGPYSVCEPADVLFDNLSDPIDERYATNWTFGDGNTSTLLSPTNTYLTAGIYTVTLEVITPLGCAKDTVFNNLVEVLPSPDAGFSFSPASPSNLDPTVTFQDESALGAAWFWDFGTGDQTRNRNPVYTFPDTGFFDVTQIVTHLSGCQDTLVQRIDIRPEVRYYLPNAFTPNNDGLNDTYFGKGFLVGITNFEMTIWNRWGEQVFLTNDPNEGWNGRHKNTGQPAPNDTYVVVVSFTGPRGQLYQFQGSATVIR